MDASNTLAWPLSQRDAMNRASALQRAEAGFVTH